MEDARHSLTSGPRARGLRAKLLLLLLGCGLGLLITEFGLRVMGYGLGTSSAYQPDPYCGARLVPGFRGWHTSENRVWIEINRHGFRDRERTVRKPPGTFRIAVLGDSFTEALQVPLDETYCAVLERKLNAKEEANQRIEVLNCGVSGYGTAQQLELLRHYVGDFEPDLVVLQFLASNDVSNNSRRLDGDTGRPFYTLEGDKLKLDDSFLRDPERIRFATSRWVRAKDFVVQHSRIGALIYQLRQRSRARHRAAGAAGGAEAGLAMEAFREPADGDWQQAWKVTDRLLVELARETRSRGAEFVVLMANSGVEVHPQPSVREQLARQLGVADLSYPQQRLMRLGDRQGFAVISLAEPMRQYAAQHGTYMHGFKSSGLGEGHWNEHGHRFAGLWTARCLRALEVLPE